MPSSTIVPSLPPSLPRWSLSLISGQHPHYCLPQFKITKNNCVSIIHSIIPHAPPPLQTHPILSKQPLLCKAIREPPAALLSSPEYYQVGEICIVCAAKTTDLIRQSRRAALRLCSPKHGCSMDVTRGWNRSARPNEMRCDATMFRSGAPGTLIVLCLLQSTSQSLRPSFLPSSLVAFLPSFHIPPPTSFSTY